MRAVQYDRFGSPDVLHLVEQATPAPEPGSVRIQVRACGVNFADTLMRQNRYALNPEPPYVLGNEVSGVIDAVGAGVEGLEVGDRVGAALFASGRGGGYATHVVVNANFVVPLPDAISFEVAAALMVQGLTALHLVRQAPPRGKSVLVTAAAGGVGLLLVQLARRAGAARIIGAASTTAKLELARKWGADEGVNYLQADWVDQTRAMTENQGVALIYESAGGDITTGCLQVLGPLGQLVIYGALNIQRFNLGVPELLGMIFKNQSVTGFAFQPLLSAEGLRNDLNELFELVRRGELHVEIGGRYGLGDVAGAHRALEQRASTGKLLVVP